jgi:hypothetical protein
MSQPRNMMFRIALKVSYHDVKHIGLKENFRFRIFAKIYFRFRENFLTKIDENIGIFPSSWGVVILSKIKTLKDHRN